MKNQDLLKMKRGELRNERHSMLISAGDKDKLPIWHMERLAEIEELLKGFDEADLVKPKTKKKKKKLPKERGEPYSPDISKFMQSGD